MRNVKVGVYQLAVIFIASFSIIGISNNSWAWGNMGHEAIAKIAEENMTPAALAQVHAILGNMTMEQAAEWPDQIKHQSGWRHTAPYHFANIKLGQSYFSQYSRPGFLQRGDVIRALVKSEDILRNSSATAIQKKYALCFLEHFEGDLQQPLHEANRERGGNEIKITFFGRNTNLHAIWDFGMFNEAVWGQPRSPNGYQNIGPQDIDRFVSVLPTPTAAQIANWQNSYIMDWSRDARSKVASIYQDWNGDSQAYYSEYVPYAENAIVKAGYRLAAYLDAVMTNQPFQAQKAQALRQEILAHMGGTDQYPILLGPSNGASVGNGGSHRWGHGGSHRWNNNGWGDTAVGM